MRPILSLLAIPQTRDVRKSRPPQRRLALIAVVTWPIIVTLGWDRVLFGGELQLVASLLLYFVVSFELRCGWVPFMVIAGTVFGLMSDPLVKGGTHESMMWESVNHLTGGTAIGLLVGLVSDSIPRIRQIPQNHMK